MTNLTDKWKKGELPEGVYYFKLPNGETMIGTDYCLATYLLTKDSNRCEVLGEVPSYEEWEKLNWYAGNGVEENQELKMENTKLKELLKECIIYVDKYVAFSVVRGNEEREVESKELLTKINQVLGEE